MGGDNTFEPTFCPTRISIPQTRDIIHTCTYSGVKVGCSYACQYLTDIEFATNSFQYCLQLGSAVIEPDECWGGGGSGRRRGGGGGGLGDNP